MKKSYFVILTSICLCIFNISNGQPSFGYSSPSYLTSVAIGTYETVSATVINNGASGTFDFECDLITTSGASTGIVIGKYCTITVNSGNQTTVNFNSGSMDANPINPSGGAGSYKIQIIAMFSSCFQCGNSGCPIDYITQSLPVTVTTCTAPNNGTISPSSPTVIEPNAINLSVSATGTTPFTYQWFIWNGSSWSSLTNTSPYSGTTSQTMTINPTTTSLNGNYYDCVVTNACGNQNNINDVQLIVNSSGTAPIANFSVSQNTITQGGTINTTNYSSGSPTPTYSWTVSPSSGVSFSPSNTATNPNITFTNIGTYTIYLTASNSNGSNQANTSINVTSSSTVPTANFSVSQNTITQGGTISTTNNSSGSPLPTYSWIASPSSGISFSPSNTATNPNITFGNVGTYTIYLTATNSNGSNQTSTTIIVNPSPITVTVNGTPTIAPWQRAGESYYVTMSATTSDGSNWRIVAHDVNGINSDQYSTYQSSGSTISNYSFTFSNPTSAIIYYAQNATGSKSSNISSQTEIIEKKWLSKNVCYYNNSSQQLNIPLKYIQGTSSINYYFSRVSLTSTAETTMSDNIVTGTQTLSGNTNQFISESYSNSNIGYVTPGVFNFQITYYPSGLTENGQFDLTKFGNANNILGGTNFDPNKIVVLIGGINNTLDKDIRDLATAPNQSNASWSIANDMVFGNHCNSGNGNNYNTWYIATCNIQSIQKNAYDIGNCLQAILDIVQQSPFSATNPDLNIIAHSKGGLETRIMLSNNGIPLYGVEGNFNYNSAYYDCSPLSSYLHSITFLGSPHQGANSAYFEYISVTGPNPLPSYFNYALGAIDLHPNSQVINFLMHGETIPSGFNLRIENITGYDENYWFYQFYGGDGLVTKSSSENPNISYASVYRQYYIKDAIGSIEDIYNPFHSFLPRSVVLNDAQNTCEYDVLLPYPHTVYGTVSLMDRITAIINNSSIQSSCPDPNVVQLSVGTYSSVLSNASISLYDYQNLNYKLIGKTDENGLANLYFYDSIPLNDTLLITIPGIEGMKILIDSNIAKTHSLRVPMFHIQNSSLLTESSVSLVNQNPISTNSSIQLIVTAQNASHYFINSPHNQDSLFISLPVNANHYATVSLDTGINILHIKFIGILSDTDDVNKTVYYFPDSLMSLCAATQTIYADSSSIRAKMFVDNNFYNLIQSILDTFPLLKGGHDLKFSKFGYCDSIFHIDSISSINIHLKPINYSSLSDSSVIDFTSGYKTNYWKTISFLESARKSNISIKQYNDNFSGMGLKAKSRKFEMRHLNSNWSGIRFAAVLDQIEYLSRDSIYLMKISNDTSFTKVFFDTNGTVAGYDSIVQKLTYNYINFDSGTVNKEALIIMKKLAPVVRSILPLNINVNDSLKIPLSIFFSNPDSIRSDMIVQLVNATPQLNLQVIGNSVLIKPTLCWSGNASFTMKAQHDGLIRNNTILVNVIGLPTPTITANGATTFCNGNSVILTASAANSYLWSNGITSQNDTVSTAGNYSVMVTESNGCSASSTVINITIDSIPDAKITHSGSTTFCYGDSVILYTVSATSYLWSNGATTQNITVKQPGNYIVTVTNSCGTAISPVTTVTVNPLPFAEAGINQTVCAGSSVILTATGGTSYQWNNGVTQNGPFIPVATNIYTVTVTNSNNCSATDDVTVTVNSLPVAEAGNSQSVCAGTPVILNASGGTSYQWSNGITQNISFIPAATSIYTVTVTNSNNCSATDNVTVTVNPLPFAKAGSNQTVCTGSSVILIATGGTSYQWNNGVIQGVAFVPTSIQTYTVTVTDVNECSATDNVTIAVNPLPDKPIVQVNGIVLMSSLINNGNYQWYYQNNPISGATSQYYTADSTGNYFIIVTDSITGCSSNSTFASVIVTKGESIGTSSFVSIYPNPASNQVTVEFPAYSAKNSTILYLYNIDGKLLNIFPLTAVKLQLNISDLSCGVYIIKVIDNNFIEVNKLVKK